MRGKRSTVDWAVEIVVGFVFLWIMWLVFFAAGPTACTSLGGC